MRKIRKILSLIPILILTLFFIPVSNVGDVYASDTDTVNILMIGNSLTYSSIYNPTSVDVLKSLCKGGGKKVYIDYVAYDSENLSTYADSSTYRGSMAYAAISSRTWDYVILQQYTDYATSDYSTTKNAVAVLTNYIKKCSPDAQVLLKWTWPYSGGYYYWCWTQHNAMKSNYYAIASAVGASVIDSADVFENAWEKGYYPYQDDGNHPNADGVFCDACAIYSNVFRESPVNSSYNGGLSDTAAADIKRFAWDHYTGFGKDGNDWIYYENGTQSSCTGLVKDIIPELSCQKKWYYVKDGVFTNATGITKKADGSSSKWYFVKNGIYKKSTGIAKKADGSSKTWFFVKDGVYTKSAGLAQKADGSSKTWYFVKDGTYTKSTGLAQKADGSSETWYFVKDGVYTKSAGLAQKADGSSKTWYFVKDGVYTKATGIAQKADGSSKTWYFVKDGTYTKLTGLAQKADGSSAKWYFVKDGVYTKSTGIAKKADGSSSTWYYVEKGVFTKSTCIAKKADASSCRRYYVVGGVFTKYTGEITINGVSYTLNKGKVTNPAVEHNYTSETTKEATCTENGEITYTCSYCGKTYTKEIPATGHDYKGETTKEAACTENGEITYTCDACGDTYTEEIPATGHDYKGETTKEATDTEAGEMTYTCDKCGDSYTEAIPITQVS